MANPKAKIIKRPGERITGNLKKNAWSAATESLALIILGILFVVLPDTMIKILAYIVGGFFVIKGLYGVISYYTDKTPKNGFDYGLFSAVVSILIGVAAFLIGEDVANVLRVIIGIIIIYESLVRIFAATNMASAGIDNWRYLLAIAIIMFFLGLFITFYSGAVVALIGWMMIVVGVIGMVGDVMFIKYVNTIIEKLGGKK